MEAQNIGPIPPNKMNNDDTSVISISEAFNSDLISGIPGNYRCVNTADT